MDRKGRHLTIADVAGWGSALATFGLIQGALYLQAYWGRFGLDPFQFVAVSELALAGLAGIGVVLCLMLFCLTAGRLGRRPAVQHQAGTQGAAICSALDAIHSYGRIAVVG